MTTLTQEVQYRLASITPMATPQDSDGIWHQYVIAQGTNLINGARPGGLAEVQYLVQDMIDRLNERSAGKTRPRIKPARK
jgi:hypothetical protein